MLHAIPKLLFEKITLYAITKLLFEKTNVSCFIEVTFEKTNTVRLIKGTFQSSFSNLWTYYAGNLKNVQLIVIFDEPWKFFNNPLYKLANSLVLWKATSVDTSCLLISILCSPIVVDVTPDGIWSWLVLKPFYRTNTGTDFSCGLWKKESAALPIVLLHLEPLLPP